MGGATGAKGGTGAQGPQGETGAQGPQGGTGADGADGADGSKGATGAKGDIGPKGETGADGADGADGAKGETGGNGAKGEKGETGAAGNDGSPGAKGEKGLRGEQGRQGEQGLHAHAKMVSAVVANTAPVQDTGTSTNDLKSSWDSHISTKTAMYLGIAGIVICSATILWVGKDGVQKRQKFKDSQREVAQLERLVSAKGTFTHQANADKIPINF